MSDLGTSGGQSRHNLARERVKMKRAQEKTEEVLRGHGLYRGAEQETVGVVYDAIMSGSSDYPLYQQAELLVAACRIGVWETQRKFDCRGVLMDRRKYFLT